jgi:hypothetical protein
MDWEKFHLWHNYLLNLEHKDIIINKVINEFSRVLVDQKIEKKENIEKNQWQMYGKINSLLNKIKIKFNINLELPRKRCEKTQKFNRKFDIQTGMMYNMSANQNGLDSTDSDYFYVPIHKTRRHIHGVPNSFLELYILNMIETAEWEKYIPSYYYDSTKMDVCAIYKCPEKYCIKNKEKIYQSCNATISLLPKILELEKFLNVDERSKINKFFIKKMTDNFRTNFPKKSRYITYCMGSCVHTNGFIHNGIPKGKQRCHDCRITFCRECNKTPYHFGELCKFENENVIPFDNPENYRKCPGCEIWIEREEGCAHIKCLCGVHFCYQCRSVLCANDPYFHVCRVENPDPHFRDFIVNHHSVQYEGEIACNCKNCN